MEIFKFTDINSILLPIGVFAIFLAIWQFGSTYTKEGILQLFMQNSFRGVYIMIEKLFAYLGYVAFGLMMATGAWLVFSIFYTLIQKLFFKQDISTAVVIICSIVLIILIIPLVLMIWRAKQDKKGIRKWDGDIKPIQPEEKATTIRRCLTLIEENNKAMKENNKTIDRILTLLEKEDGV